MSLEHINNQLSEAKAMVTEAKANISNYTKKEQDCKKRIDEYVNSNSLAKDRKACEEQVRKNNSAATTLIATFACLEVVLFIVLLVLENTLENILKMDVLYIQLAVLALPLILVVIAIVKKLANNKIKKQIDSISSQLVDFDKPLKRLNDELASYQDSIRNNEATVSRYSEKIADLEIDLKYSKYEKNYALVFVGTKNSQTNEWKGVRNLIEIDGVDHGYADMPFKPIYVSPGVHTIKVTAQETFGGNIYTHTSQVYQFDATNESVYFEFVIGSGGGINTRMHKTASAFFNSTGLKKV